jgi:hypothetical protein
MSLTTTLAVNSGPLIIRTYNDLTGNNTYLLSTYDTPVSSNRLLMTSTNGRLVPTDQPVISSLVVGSTLYGNNAVFSTLNASTVTGSSISGSTINSGPLVASSLYVNGTAQYTGLIQNYTASGSATIDSSWWGRYNFITSATADTNYTILNAPRPADGTFLTITNAQPASASPIYAITVTGTSMIAGGNTRTIALHSTLRMIYNSTVRLWYSLTNN